MRIKNETQITKQHEKRIISFKNVSKSFDGKCLLDRVSFDIDSATITTLLGQNGAGKSTIAKLILGIEKQNAGDIIVDKEIRIGYVPQKLNNYQSMPLNGHILLSMLAPKYARNFFQELTEFIDVNDLLDKDISELSGGQLQKIVLIGTILDKPNLLLLDEPTQYLDVASQQQFYKLARHMKDNHGTAIFMISHDLFTVMKNSDQVICLNGHVCCSGIPAEVTKNSELKSTISEIGLYIHQHDHEHH